METIKLLVTGAAGLLGSRITEIAAEMGFEVYSCLHKSKPRFGIPVTLDITDPDNVNDIIAKLKPDVIAHTAALTNVDTCELNKDLANKVNCEGTANIAKASKKAGSFLVYCSTDYVFDGQKGSYKEEDRPNPVNYYGYTKLLGEKATRRYSHHWTIARTSVIYGSPATAEKLNFAVWVLDRISKKTEIQALIDQYVSPTLNTNLAEMIIEVAMRRLHGTYHLAGASRISRFEFAQKVASAFGLDASLVKPATMIDMKWTAKRPKDSSLNVEKSTRTLSKRPMTITEALERFGNEAKKNIGIPSVMKNS